MSLQPGDSLGPYTVTAKIGEGGMGEVYRARDTKLDRDVALKVLPEAFTQDPDRLARFEREAKVLASLNHPNIAAIYGLEEADDTRALVLELVEGPTLADRIKRGPIPLDEALPIAKQIAEALEAAHEAGVIHRDLKPANIKVREDGTVKVLDFGLAKALDPTSEGDPSQSPTLTAAATQMGVIMGTAAYMSPEQARGSVVDRRADIWAFGVVLYEMLTGRRPFEGSDVSEVMAGVIKSEPEWDALPEDLPLGLNGYLRRCLHKEPKQRLQAVGDMRLAMEGAFESPRSSSSIGRAIRPADSPRFRWLMIGISGVLAAVTGLTVWTLKPSPQSPVNLMRFAIATSESAALRISPNTPDLAFSPNGTNVIYSGPGVGGTGSQLFLRPLDQVTGVPLRGTEGAISPFISPDGQWVGFATGSGTTVRKVPIFGGPPETVATLPVALRGASWGQDDQIIMGTTTGGLFLVSGQGGQPEALTTPDSGENHRWPYALPDHNAVVFMIGNNLAGGQLAALALETRQVTPLGLAGTSPYFDSTGHLVYTAADGSVRAAPFDPDRLVITGDPVQLIDGVVAKTSGAANLSISRNGRLVYVAAVAGGPQRTLVWVDRDGSEERLAAPPRAYNYPRISPDDSQIALDIRDQDNDIWIWDIARESLTRLTHDPAVDLYPVWTRDGHQLAFASDRGGASLFLKASDGVGDTESLTAGPAGKFPYFWSLDGTRLVYRDTPLGVGELVALSVKDMTSAPLFETEFNESNAELSPNGQWIAYQSNASGQEEIYVRSFPDPSTGGRILVSSNGGMKPLWSPDGRELFYVANGDVMVAQTIPGTTHFAVEPPMVVLEAQYYFGDLGRNYDIARDGRFLMIKADTEANPQVTVVLNWFDELTARVPVN